MAVKVPWQVNFHVLAVDAIVFCLWLPLPSFCVLNPESNRTSSAPPFSVCGPSFGRSESAKLGKLVETQIVDLKSSESTMRTLGPLLSRSV
jgi:hypothetical protein